MALDVLGKRTDGFHEVRMVMQAISLADELELSPHSELVVETIGADLPSDESNLAFKAAQVLCREVGLQAQVKIKIKKNIPLAAGLAGGSSDAAAVLRGLNALYKLGLGTGQLEKIAAQLGSDVPFCLQGGTSLATGRGELITPLAAAPEYFVVLANPGFAVSTASVYKNFDKTQVTGKHKIELVLAALAQADRANLAKNIFNNLETVTIKQHPVIQEIKDVMLAEGALASLMSGSGPSVFALANDEQTAVGIAQAVKKQTGSLTWVSKTRRSGERDE